MLLMLLEQHMPSTCHHPTWSDPVQIVLTRACLYGRGACADFALKSAALIKTNPTGWFCACSWCRQIAKKQGLAGTLPPKPRTDLPPIAIEEILERCVTRNSNSRYKPWCFV